MNMEKRKYKLSQRAEQQAATRERIVVAAMHLHEELGPAQTSIKAIAEKAGVQRLTVYRHFPDDSSLFQACTSHWFSLNPPPQEGLWDELSEPLERTHMALLAFNRYYRQTEQMLKFAYRDVDKVEALQTPMALFDSYLDQVCNSLVKIWKKNCGISVQTTKRLKITLRHALSFSTWYSLQSQKLSDKKIAELVTGWLDAITLQASRK